MGLRRALLVNIGISVNADPSNRPLPSNNAGALVRGLKLMGTELVVGLVIIGCGARHSVVAPQAILLGRASEYRAI